jgi:hypothetical protein
MSNIPLLFYFYFFKKRNLKLLGYPSHGHDGYGSHLGFFFKIKVNLYFYKFYKGIRDILLVCCLI